MNIYDIDFDQQAPELLPPDKRDVPRLAVVRALLAAEQWCRDLVLGSYKNGATAPDYAAGTYDQFDQVVYNKAVYYSLLGNNTALPTDTDWWLKVQDNFLGVNERVKFNGQNIVLEYALNQRFEGTFRPPPSVTPSDIYMTILPLVVAGFNIGETTGSAVGQTTSSDAVGFSRPLIRTDNFQVHVKASIYADTNDQELRDFINLYIPASLKYTITTY